MKHNCITDQFFILFVIVGLLPISTFLNPWPDFIKNQEELVETVVVRIAVSITLEMSVTK